jgi:hypothetical protein
MLKAMRLSAIVALILALLGIGNEGPGWAIGTFFAIFTVAVIGSIFAGMNADSRRRYLLSFKEKRQRKVCRTCGVEIWRFADYCGEFGDHCENTEPALYEKRSERTERPQSPLE